MNFRDLCDFLKIVSSFMDSYNNETLITSIWSFHTFLLKIFLRFQLEFFRTLFVE